VNRLRPALIAANVLLLLAAFGGAAWMLFGLGWIGDKDLARLAVRAGLLLVIGCAHLPLILAWQRADPEARGRDWWLVAAPLIAGPLVWALMTDRLP
jgi:hypothetical protein